MGGAAGSSRSWYQFRARDLPEPPCDNIAVMAAQKHVWLDATKSENERIQALLGAMTLDEKIACFGRESGVPRLGVKGSPSVEGLHGLAQDGWADWLPKNREKTTTFPQSYGMGQTWDPDLLRRCAEAQAKECRHLFHRKNKPQAGLIVFAPNADIGRDPRWGRTEECFGECPHLVGELSLAVVEGLQGDDPDEWLCCSLMKHFLANSNENDREKSSSDFDERLWREYYSVGFRRGMCEGKAGAFMAAYNAHNGTPCHIHPMLQQIVRDEWGFDGQIVTDGGGYRLLRTHHRAAKTEAEAAAKIIKAGISRFLDNYEKGLRQAIAKGLLTEADLDRVLAANFRILIRLGLMNPDRPSRYASLGESTPPWESAEHRELALEATRKSIVLLKNDADLLPLQADAGQTIAVVGPYANRVETDWYSGVPPYFVTPLEGIRRAVGHRGTVLHSEDPADWPALAAQADVVVAVTGNMPVGHFPWAKVGRASDGREAVDRESIELEDEAWLRDLHKINPKMVLVLTSSFPFAIHWSQAHLPAIVHMAHNSQEQGSALADVLFGTYNPAGRLIQTWVKSADDLPPMMDYDIRNGRTYLYFQGEPLYPFGHGLSYSRFAYRTVSALLAGDRIEVTVELENESAVFGEEVVQVYARFPTSAVPRPRQALCAFRRVPVWAHTKQAVRLDVRLEDLRYWDADHQKWVLESGPVELHVGGSSASLPLSATVKIP